MVFAAFVWGFVFAALLGGAGSAAFAIVGHGGPVSLGDIVTVFSILGAAVLGTVFSASFIFRGALEVYGEGRPRLHADMIRR
jgi:hypothetical protein